VLVLLLSLMIGLIGGRLRRTGAHVARPDLLWLPVLVAGVAARALVEIVGGDAAVPVLAGSLVLLVAFAVRNCHLVGMAVIAVGLLANLEGLLANDGMPVRPSALVAAGITSRSELASVQLDAPRHLEGSDDRVAILGDVLPVPGAGIVLSFGDLIVAAGLSDVVAQLTSRRRRQRATTASVAHDWGTAPKPSPESASHHSANIDLRAPAAIELDSAAATDSSPDLVDATHSR
jgi:hypothetical protein